MADTHDSHFVAVVNLALDALGDVADAVEVGDGRAAEFHYDAGHEGESVARLRGGRTHTGARREEQQS